MGMRLLKKLMLGGLIFAIMAAGRPAGAEDDLPKLQKSLEKTFPQLKIDTISESSVSGLYLITSGDQIFFVNREGYLFYGNLWGPDGKNLTVAIHDRLIAEKLKKLPLDKALVIGSGPKKVIEFDDPDCPFSRKANDFLAKRTDVTRYIFLFPLKQLHAEAEKKSIYILAQPEPGQAFLEVLDGRMDGKPLPAANEQGARLAEMVKLGQSVGVNSTPTLWVEGVPIAGADIQRMMLILDKKGTVSGAEKAQPVK